MIETAIVIAFALIQLVIVRMVAGHVAHLRCNNRYPQLNYGGRPRERDWTIGILTGLLWPVTMSIWAVWRICAWLFTHVPKVGAEAAHYRAEWEREHLERADDVEMPSS